MKLYYQYFGLLIFIFLSFYYTDKVAVLVQNRNPLVKTIKEKQDKYQSDYIDASIEGNTIIPGINGKTVNVIKSFNMMKSLGEFNEYYLVYDEVAPKISLENNKDKIIIKGNPKLRQIALIIKNNPNIRKHLEQEKIKATVLFTQDMNLDKKFEYINHEKDKITFDNVESLLNKNKINKHICLIENNLNICKENKKYLIMPYLVLNEANIIDIKNNIENGSIVLIKENAKLNDFKILLRQIKYQDLDIVYLSHLIAEYEIEE